MTNKNVIKIFIVTFIITAVSLSLFLRLDKKGSGWGKGNMLVSEASYYGARMDRIIKTWIQARQNANFKRDGYFVDSYQSYLIIDLEKQAMWIEDTGRIWEDNYLEFPPGLKWTFYHCTIEGTKVLNNRIILKYRGFDSSGQTPEAFHLVGTGRGKGCICCQIRYQSGSAGYDRNEFSIPQYGFNTTGENILYGSLIVSEQEYQAYLDSVPLESEQENIESINLSQIEQNKIAWNKIEKLLYQEFEKQINSMGFNLDRIVIEPGEDFSAAQCEIKARNGGIIEKLLDRSYSPETYPKIDYLGNDIWYVKSGPDPKFPGRSMMRSSHEKQIDLEFLVSDKGKISKSQYDELLEKGRQKQLPNQIPESKWKVTLDNGMKIEFLGICENPSAGKKWWGPDGTFIDYVPYVNTTNYGRTKEDRNIYEFAWRTTNGANNIGTGFSAEGCNGSYFHAFYDRYGNSLRDEMNAEGFGFDKSKVMTTFKMTFKNDNNLKQVVLFKNISLVPGQDQGFEIEIIEAEE